MLLTSRSSGLTPSSFQDACTHHPERVLVAHPFNTPHLVPLIEIVGGSRTDAAAVDAAMATFAHLGNHPIRINAELPGHVTNRLQAAMWREAYDLVARGGRLGVTSSGAQHDARHHEETTEGARA